MDCPVCNEPMVVLELNQVEIDHCLACGGIWLDRGELALLLEGAEDKDTVLKSFTVASETKEEKRKCPICLKRMEKVLAGRAKEILIDRCARGDGLWFDRGELYSVIERVSFDTNNRILTMLKDVFAQDFKTTN